LKDFTVEENTFINLEEIVLVDYKNSVDSKAHFNTCDWIERELPSEQVLFKLNIHLKNGTIFQETLKKSEFMRFMYHLYEDE